MVAQHKMATAKEDGRSRQRRIDRLIKDLKELGIEIRVQQAKDRTGGTSGYCGNGHE